MVLGGYILVYASIANSGIYATEPWLGVVSDAYTDPETYTNAAAKPSKRAPVQSTAPSAQTGVLQKPIPGLSRVGASR
jgi:hypothetical protein